MPVICAQNELALMDPNRDVIVGWLQQDEPDNAQPLVGKVGLARLGWGSPIAPAEVRERYRQMRARDPARPVFMNLGKGVAWDAWKGRGNRTGHPEDYPEYVQAADIVSFDIYPAAETDPALAGRLEVVAQGTRRLLDWAGQHRPVWTVIGASRVSNPQAAVDPAQIRAQVWMSIISGARGIVYFVHQFKPRFVEASWFESADLAQAIKRINAQVQGLAKVIASPPSDDLAEISLRDDQGLEIPAGQVAVTTRRDGKVRYLFLSSLASQPMRATLRLRDGADIGSVDVIDEDRSLKQETGMFEDDLPPYAVRLYRVSSRRL
jgi:hypothetical protein